MGSIAIGSITHREDGYNYIKMGKRTWLPYHRYVVEQALGRKLSPSEHVHHRNGVCGDDRIENLPVVNAKQHKRIHVEAERIGLKVQAGELVVVPAEQQERCVEEEYF